jgi:hypothetical protein
VKYADDAVLYSPLGRFEGVAAIEDQLAEQRARFPGLRAAVHDRFTSADGTRACFRTRLSWDGGSSAETHSIRQAGGHVTEQITGVSTFDMAKVLLVDLGLDFPRDVPDRRLRSPPTGPRSPAASSAPSTSATSTPSTSCSRRTPRCTRRSAGRSRDVTP